MKVIKRIKAAEWFDNNPPVNLMKQDEWLFKTHLRTFIHEIKIYKGKNVFFLPDHILVHNFKIWRAELTNHYIQSFIYTAKRMIKAALRKTVRLKGKYVLVTDDWSWSYFHWTCDALQRVNLVKNELAEYTVLLPAHFADHGYIMDSLKLYDAKIKFFSKNENLLIEELLVPSPAGSSGVFHYEVVRSMAAYVKQQVTLANSHLPTPARIYISRGKARYRKILNEDQIVKTLQALDFYILYAEDLPLAAQVKLFSQCQFLISLHGAGLTNELYLPAAAAVLEIRHPKDHLNNCYYLIATALQQQYYYLLAESKNPDPHYADVVVNNEALKNQVLSILAHQNFSNTELQPAS